MWAVHWGGLMGTP
jgi:hypothetical protein